MNEISIQEEAALLRKFADTLTLYSNYTADDCVNCAGAYNGSEIRDHDISMYGGLKSL